MDSLDHTHCDEVAGLSVAETMQLLMTLVIERLLSQEEFFEQAMSSWIEAVMGTANDIRHSLSVRWSFEQYNSLFNQPQKLSYFL